VLALVSLASVALFAALVHALTDRKRPLVVAVATWAFASAPAHATYRFEPDGVAPLGLCLVAVLLFWATGRLRAAVAVAFVAAFVRNDGLPLFAVACAVAVVAGARPAKGGAGARDRGGRGSPSPRSRPSPS
jgi:divalent metal cation (Fe/Co/Zn/Cd) transporter